MAGLLQRLSLAAQIIFGRSPQGRQPRFIKEAPYNFNYRKYPQYQMTNYRGYVEEGFETNSVIYAAIMYKVRAISSVKWRAYRGDPDSPEPLEPQHEISRLLRRPNQHQSFMEFMAQQIVYLNLMGSSYTYLDRETSATPKALWSLRPDRVRVVPGERELKGYVYRSEIYEGDGLPIIVDDMMHVKLPNPGDVLEGLGYGLSPIMAMGKSGDVDNSVTDFLKILFENGLMLPGMVSFDVPMDENQVARARARWQELYGGYENWTDVAILDSGGKYQQLTPTFKDMGFEAIDERNESRILGPLGVPPILIGTRLGLMRSTYSNYEEARRAFWEDTMVPELANFVEEFTYFLGDGDIFIRPDYSRVPALRKNVAELAEAALKLWQMNIPANLATAAVGLDIEDIPGGDLPRSMIETAQQGQQMGKAVDYVEGEVDPSPALPSHRVGTKSESPEDRADVPLHVPTKEPPSNPPIAMGGSLADEEKARIWKAIDDIAIAGEDDFLEGARSQFEVDRKNILAIIGEAGKKALIRKEGPIRWADERVNVDEYLEEAEEGWRETFTPLVEGVVNRTGEWWAVELGLEFDVRNLEGEAWFADYMLQFAQPLSQTSKDTIHEILARGQAEGWSVQEMQDAMSQTFEQWMNGEVDAEDYHWILDRLPPHRAEMIARTETTRATNAGTYNLGNEWGMASRTWLATSDDRTRDSHSAADGQTVGMDEPFIVGGYEMMYPGDASRGAPPSEFVSCRCTQLLNPAEEED